MPYGDMADGGAGIGEFGGAAADSGLSVRVSPTAPTVCPGQCVELVPMVSGGLAPYLFMWSQGGATDAGVLTVCPDSTTTYEITVSQTLSRGGDVPGSSRDGSTSVTVTVAGDCRDADSTMADAAVPLDAADRDGVTPADLDANVDADTLVDSNEAYCADGAWSIWTGCEQLSTADYPETCPEQSSSTWNMCLPKPLFAGQPYRIMVTFDVTGAIGTAFEAKIWGTSSDCAKGISQGQLLSAQPWPSQSPFTGNVMLQSCATPDETYPEIIFQQGIGANSGVHTFSNLSPATIQICAGCGAEP